MKLVELDYITEPARVFAGMADRPWSVFLDSGRERSTSARFDIFTADPYLTLTTRGLRTEIASRDERRVSEEDPLALLQELLGDPVEAPAQLPFPGGAIGYFAYDLGRRYERWPSHAADDIGLPEVAVGLYDWAVIIDHELRQSWIIGHGRDARTLAEWDRRIECLSALALQPRVPFEVLSDVRSNLDRAAYDAAFDRIKQHIRAGDCYQVNLTQRFSARVSGSSWSAYERLRAVNPAPYSAYINLPEGQVLSSSPERFLRVAQGRAITQPIKGTRPRRSDATADAALAAELRQSGKDRAENVMIVDLLRNDLGKSCKAGSVRATKMFDVESFANVHHLVSTIEGVPAAGCHALDLLRDCFPGGSITGAPKVRAMQIIEECEPHRRGVYCGAIGYVGFDGTMDTNIAIRTLVRTGDQLYAWAGGGIVADSDVDSEYQESLDKASGLLTVFANEDVSAAV